MIFIAMHLKVSLLEDIQTDVWRMTKLALKNYGTVVSAIHEKSIKKNEEKDGHS